MTKLGTGKFSRLLFFKSWIKKSINFLKNYKFFVCSFQVYALKFNVKMKHMTQMPFTLTIADPSK